MAWKYREPSRSDFDTEEEYESNLAAYESALDDYCDRCIEDEKG